ncbi:MAG: FAD-binding protein [Chloroflexi bacterium]|nr:FAD-binding protein [Chloroflexota bacterium]
MPTVKMQRADVVIVGSGGAAVAAAVEVAEQGASAIVLEREAELGGASNSSTGFCCLVDTPLQREIGLQDSPDLAFQDWIHVGRGAANEEWARFYIDHTLHELFEWAQERGVRWVGLLPYEGNSVPRMHGPENGGPGLWKALYETALARGARIWLPGTAATEILMEGGRAVGVRAHKVDTGEDLEFRASAIVLASGGFASNIDMIYEHCPQFRGRRILEGSHIGARGEGHLMAAGTGAALTHMNELALYIHAVPDHLDPTGRRGLVIWGLPRAIWVNSQGRRFRDEPFPGAVSGTSVVLGQEPAEYWAIIDSDMVEGVTVVDPYYWQPGTDEPDEDKVSIFLVTSPHVLSANSLEDLAQRAGLPATALAETVSTYNSYLERGLDRDPDFGRLLPGMRPIKWPPYFAFHFFPLARATLGGVKADLRCRVLNKWYEPIPGLFAAGEVAGAAGGHIQGKVGLGGTGVGPSLLSGRVAGAWAAHEAGIGPGFVGKANRPGKSSA